MCNRRFQRLHFPAMMLLALALVLTGVTGKFSRQQQQLAEFTLEPEAYGKSVTLPEYVEIPAGSSPLVVVCEAPVDQSWIYLECALHGVNGIDTAAFTMHLEHYHGKKNGVPWHTGGQSTTRTLEVKSIGPHQMRIFARAGYGTETLSEARSPGPPVRLRILSGMPTVRLMTWTTFLIAAAGIALLLRGFMPRQPATGPKPDSGNRFLFIDGLRGVAVLAVLVCHFFVPEISLLAPSLEMALCEAAGDLARNGALGVEVFFVLSGFVIAHSVSSYRIMPGFAGRFILRRAIRLDPPYYVTLGLMLAIVASNHPDGLLGAWREYGGLGAALSNMFYLHDLFDKPTPLDISWSLCLEIQFYLSLIMLGGLAEMLGRRFKPNGQEARALPLAMILVLLILGSLAFWYPTMNRFDFAGTWFRFALGVLTYMTFRKHFRLIGWLAVMGLIVALSIWFRDLRGMAAAVTAGVILFAGNTGRLGKWLSNRPIQFFGRISYSMYLIHLAAGIGVANLLWTMVEPSPRIALLLMVAGMVSSVAGSLLLYHLFEKPGVSISHRLK